jgi:hypothetical protein
LIVPISPLASLQAPRAHRAQQAEQEGVRFDILLPWNFSSLPRKNVDTEEDIKKSAGALKGASPKGATDRSVVEFQRELKEARRAALRRDLAEITCIGVVQIAWVAELRMVGEVECFRPELQFDLLGNPEVLE